MASFVEAASAPLRDTNCTAIAFISGVVAPSRYIEAAASAAASAARTSRAWPKITSNVSAARPAKATSPTKAKARITRACPSSCGGRPLIPKGEAFIRASSQGAASGRGIMARA